MRVATRGCLFQRQTQTLNEHRKRLLLARGRAWADERTAQQRWAKQTSAGVHSVNTQGAPVPGLEAPAIARDSRITGAMPTSTIVNDGSAASPRRSSAAS